MMGTKFRDRTPDLVDLIEAGETSSYRPEDGLEAPPRHVSALRDMRFEERRRAKDEMPTPAKPSPSEMAAKREAQNAKSRVTPDGHFCCSACGGKVVRPDNVSACAWAQRRRCDACVASGRFPPPGKRHCRKCGKLYEVRGCERFCQPHLPP